MIYYYIQTVTPDSGIPIVPEYHRIDAWSCNRLLCYLYLRSLYDFTGDTYEITEVECNSYETFVEYCLNEGLISPKDTDGFLDLELVSSDVEFSGKHGYYVITREDIDNQFDYTMIKDALIRDFFDPLNTVCEMFPLFQQHIQEDAKPVLSAAIDYFARLYTGVLKRIRSEEEEFFPESYEDDPVLSQFKLAGLFVMLFGEEPECTPTTIEALNDEDFVKNVFYKQVKL